MSDQTIVAVVVVIHFGILLYLVIGGLLAVVWRRTIWVHLALVGWALATSFYNIACPVTMLEDYFRLRAGMPVLAGGFVESYVVAAGSALGSLNRLRLITFVVIAGSWALYARTASRRRARRAVFQRAVVTVPSEDTTVR